MPKDKGNLVFRAKKLISDSFEVESKENQVSIFCKLCSSKFKVDPNHLKTQYQSHVNSAKHKKCKEKNILQPPICSSISNVNTQKEKIDSYSTKLATAFIEAGIPLWKLRHSSIKKFFLEEHKENLPCIKTFYNKIDVIYHSTFQKIKEYIREHPVYFIVDETKDVLKRYALNILVGKIDGSISKSMLLCTLFLKQTNHTTVQQSVHKACALLYGSEIPFKKIWFLISDQAPYMVKAGKVLKETFPNLKHITCLAHALNIVCESIKDEHGVVNDMIAGMKAILAKSNVRSQQFSEICKLPLPPSVIEIRWNSWLNAAFYYAKNFTVIKSFIVALDTDSKAVEKLKKCIEETDLEQSLFDLNKYAFLTEAVTRLQKHGLTVEEQMTILSSVRSKLTGYQLEKLEKSLSKNPDWNFFEKLSVDEKIKCNFVPMVSVDVERSFSIYRYILSDRRYSLTESHLAMLNVIQFNNFIDDEEGELE